MHSAIASHLVGCGMHHLLEGNPVLQDRWYGEQQLSG